MLFFMIDRNSAWKDNVKFCATKSDRIPKFHPEEVHTTAVLDRIMALELQLSEVQRVTTMHSGQIQTVIADIRKMKIDLMSNPAEW